MSQEQIIKTLKKGDALTTEEITKRLRISRASCGKSLRNLAERGEIKRTKIKKKLPSGVVYLYKYSL